MQRAGPAPPTLNPALAGFTCLRCAGAFGIVDLWEGCPHCRDAGYPASVTARYASHPSMVSRPGATGLLRFGGWLPYDRFVSLGEGNTPLLRLDMLAGELACDRAYVKHEGTNPTGSHKDRMSCQAVARALDIGAGTLIAASSGNAGVSLATYAAAAGLSCEIVSTADCNPGYRRAMQMAGARVVATRDAQERWTYMAQRVRRDGCFPVTNYLSPPVGSNPFGVEGCKTVALELYEQLGGAVPDAVLAPTDRADLIWGLYAGFNALRGAGFTETMPRLYAVEPFRRISAAISGADYRQRFQGRTKMLSIAGTTVTYQGVAAVRQSAGGAVVVDDEAVRADQQLLAQHGIYLELSCASVITGLRRLLSTGEVRRSDLVVVIGTSNGFKDPVVDQDCAVEFVA